MVYIDPLYLILLGPPFLLTLWAQLKVRTTFSALSRIPAAVGLTGAEVARLILRRSSIHDAEIEEGAGWLWSHYDLRHKTLGLAPGIYHDRSLTAIGVAAHEAGHAIQHAHGYGLLRIRQDLALGSVVGSNLAMILLGLGLILGAANLVKAGGMVFFLTVSFQVITLPVEFNASKRARLLLTRYGLVSSLELEGIDQVLKAVAWTYVAAALTGIFSAFLASIWPHRGPA
ncbi:MAG: zinc metallopeptidase [Candidatus Tectomicrobia bacterium]|uniref:Zinc metallopeptidase n=1 Tax=Tectimicrobiota bacterium TaxID=2528274 RepID=A0A932CLQ6_UNCTE|nr:zinc metallopeptidase [Candidatus Tectomicrobia bacterium]